LVFSHNDFLSGFRLFDGFIVANMFLFVKCFSSHLKKYFGMSCALILKMRMMFFMSLAVHSDFPLNLL